MTSSMALPQLLREWGEPSAARKSDATAAAELHAACRTAKSALSDGNISSEIPSWLQVKSWAALPQLLREWGEPSAAGKLDATAAELHATWQLIKERLRKHVARTVCALSSREGHSHAGR